MDIGKAFELFGNLICLPPDVQVAIYEYLQTLKDYEARREKRGVRAMPYTSVEIQKLHIADTILASLDLPTAPGTPKT